MDVRCTCSLHGPASPGHMETLSLYTVKKNINKLPATILISFSAFLIRGNNFVHAKQKYKYQQLWILNIFMAANELCLFLLKLFSVYYLHVTLN